ncbi:hypothetical protein CYLTODRAFT_357659 [Cylindrobasidium torrendii FP15055 ss-10]|uniref:Copper transport protein n=1 Tax=Cylindrobasidium torrendii FP15055 ss-10 TaxID=1314674 RepID=A0A0D7B2X1_9AGAR|nr:hypothetical protein CYLTODRAFT_357659 [Cylindrobasidium torrendii FP15055 ss-10]
MGDDSSGSSSSGMMVPYLHFTTGDYLLFKAWVVASSGATVGACIGLFLLATLDRLLAAGRAVMEGHWQRRAQLTHAIRLNASDTEIAALRSGSPMKESTTLHTVMARRAPTFVLSQEISRGVMFAIQSVFGMVFMLSAMTFNVAFIISIIVGYGVGETMFGRYGATARHEMH